MSRRFPFPFPTIPDRFLALLGHAQTPDADGIARQHAYALKRELEADQDAFICSTEQERAVRLLYQAERIIAGRIKAAINEALGLPDERADTAPLPDVGTVAHRVTEAIVHDLEEAHHTAHPGPFECERAANGDEPYHVHVSDTGEAIIQERIRLAIEADRAGRAVS